MVKSHVDSFLDPTFLLVRISINKPRPRFKSDTGLSRGRVQRERASRISLKFHKQGCPRSKKNDKRTIQQRTAVGWEQLFPGTMEQWEDRNVPTGADIRYINGATYSSRPHRLKKNGSKQSKHHDLHHKCLHRETNDKTF